MREAALVFILEDRSRIDGEAEFSSALRLPVEANVVAQPVRQRADRNLRIDRDGIVQFRRSDIRRNRRRLRADEYRRRGNRREEDGETETLCELHAGVLSTFMAACQSLDTAGMPLRL
jgi:hypothetical protein